MLDKKFFRQLAPNVVNMYRKHTFEKGLDVDGKKFKAYTPKYATRKKSGNIKRQSSQFKDRVTPVLTGDLFRDFKVRKIGNHGFSFGTVAHGGKVEGLNKMGRKLSTSSTPIPEDVQEFIEVFAVGYTDKRFRKEFRGGKFDLNL
tara:strand:+ start:681 stop:1115 length:435 start_codon:yes stop_codon:yes gene_type:complete